MAMARVLVCPNPARWLQRIAAHIEPEGDCWRWTLRLDHHGYGRFEFQLDGVRGFTGAHRASWLAHRSDILDPSLMIDHLCRNRACVNPWHMELVTNRVNGLRGANAVPMPGCRIHGMQNAYYYERPTPCRGNRGYWVCRICSRLAQQRWKAKKAALAGQP